MNEAEPKPTILVIEDDRQIQRLFGAWLMDEVELLFASTVKEARELFMAHQREIVLIAIDACVPMAEGTPRPKAPTTLPFVQQLREKSLDRRIVAISSDPTYRQWQMEAGCDHEVDKDEFPQFVLDLLRGGKLGPPVRQPST